MRISFDLDDTLICYQEGVRHEPNRVPLFLRFLFKEPLRLGSRGWLRRLPKIGCEVLIYTTSYRPRLWVHIWLFFYGIRVARVINQYVYDMYLEQNSTAPRISKNPKVYGIVLHVDDSEGVKLEGKKYSFDVLVVAVEDNNWTEQVIEAVIQRLS